MLEIRASALKWVSFLRGRMHYVNVCVNSVSSLNYAMPQESKLWLVVFLSFCESVYEQKLCTAMTLV